MPDIPFKPSRPLLSDVMLASAQNALEVLTGHSLSDSLAQTPVELRAATQAVTFHAMRRLGLARAVKQILVQRTPPNPLFDALLLVALALLDTALEVAHGAQAGVPPRRDLPVYAAHTVVDQAVRAAAGQRQMQFYKGLLNGVLRRFVRERSAILSQITHKPEAVWNHPAWWVKQLKQSYPEQWEYLLESANRPGPMTLRVNARRASVEQVLDELAGAGVAARAVGGNAIVLALARPVHALPGFAQGWWSVQDASAQQAAPLLRAGPGMRVLDACAAPGGKAAHLLELADIELVALDTDQRRLGRVGQNLDRLGLMSSRVSLRCADAADPASWWDGRAFDAVLADVPCTASGIVRRHPDIRWLRRETDIARTAALQRKIVDALWTTVKPGGRLLYATCSIFPQEGERQALQFLARHNDASREPAPGQILPTPGIGHEESGFYDGFFYALFFKSA